MATRIIGQGTPAPTSPLPSAWPSPEGFDRADEKLTQLRSLLSCCYGVGAEWFETIGSNHRENLLWLASDLAQDVDLLLRGKAVQA